MLPAGSGVSGTLMNRLLNHIGNLGLAAVVVLFVAFNPSTVSAVSEPKNVNDKIALSVSPAILELVLEKDRVVERAVTVINISKSALMVKIARRSFTPEELREIPEKLRGRYDASTWIQLDRDDADFILQAGESRIIPVRVKQPEQAAPGGHYASLLFQPLVPQQQGIRDAVYVYGQVAALLFMQVRGDINEELTLEKMDVLPVYESYPVMAVTLKNRGNVHLRPEGVVLIRDRDDTIIHSLTIPSTLILPGAQKTFQVEWRGASIPIGFFSAQAQVRYGRESVIKTQGKRFLLLPFLRILGMLACTGMAVWILVKGRKRIMRAALILVSGEAAGAAQAVGRLSRKEKSRNPPQTRIDKRFPRR